MAISSGTPAAHMKPSAALARPAIDSTDRSISPRMMTRVSGRAMIATSMRAETRFEKFLALRKYGDRALPITIRPSRATTSSVSHRASPRSTEPITGRDRAGAVIGRRSGCSRAGHRGG